MALPINTTSLFDELRRHLIEIDKQIEAIKTDVRHSQPVHQAPDENLVYRTKTRDGKHVLTDLLSAKASVLAAITSLQTGNKR